ncbi:STIP1 y and U box-containing protein 1 [Branchiostoma belcheri]|nr:STIP1 y and U box-containing protein 1 [Branchiostoma belcheri]
MGDIRERAVVQMGKLHFSWLHEPNFYERAVFRQPLSDRMVEPGRSTTFICKVRDMAGNSLVWEKDGRVLFVDNYRYPTRHSQNLSLKLPLVRLECGKRKFSYRGPALWNRLPTAIKTCPSMVTWSGKLHAAKRRGEYLLRVFHVSKEEEGNYTCVVNSDPPQRSTGQLKVDGFLCPRRRSGMFPDPKDCSRYYMCTAGGVKGERGYCPAGLVFDAGRKVCDKPAIVPRPCGVSAVRSADVLASEHIGKTSAPARNPDFSRSVTTEKKRGQNQAGTCEHGWCRGNEGGRKFILETRA